MKTISCTNFSELSIKTAEMIAGVISVKPDALLCFPAGETSVGTFGELIRMNRERKVSFSKCRIVGLDEWIGLGKMKSENCFSFLKKHFFDQIDYSVENLCFFNGEATDLAAELAKTENFINMYGPVDMMLLGVGMNGHLGLNEPGTSFGLYSHIVDLDNTTKTVGQKYFSEKVTLTKGITLGIKHMLESKLVILQLSGKRKAPVAARLLSDEISDGFPASAMKLHNNSFLLMDRDAAGR